MSEDLRTGGELEVPLHIWNTKPFQNWYARVKAAGNRLDGASLLWEFRPAQVPNFVFAFALQVKVWVENEQRWKDNEFILSRPDMSVVVAYCPSEDGEAGNTRLAMIQEFRSPCGDRVTECPGGSSFNPAKVAEVVAASELKQETGIEVDPSRIQRVGSPRQVAATWGTHQVHLFRCELTKEEMDRVQEVADRGEVFGVVADTERTYLHVCILENLFKTNVDYATIGMVTEALLLED